MYKQGKHSMYSFLRYFISALSRYPNISQSLANNVSLKFHKEALNKYEPSSSCINVNGNFT